MIKSGASFQRLAPDISAPPKLSSSLSNYRPYRAAGFSRYTERMNQEASKTTYQSLVLVRIRASKGILNKKVLLQ